jgi:hypothetical protein
MSDARNWKHEPARPWQRPAIGAPGDWQMDEGGPESIPMVRQQDGGIEAFYNVCPGSRTDG